MMKPRAVTLTSEEQEQIELLRGLCPVGSTVMTVLRSVSRSGMMRHVSVKVVNPKTGELLDITWNVARLAGFRLVDSLGGFRALKVGGCGTDVGFEVVYHLGRKLYGGRFFCIGEGCPANDHANGDAKRTPHAHSDAGYSLRQRWI